MAKMKLQPTSGYLILKPEDKQTKTASGIYLPDTADERPQMGVVLEVGSDEITDSGAKRQSPVQKGDRVVYKKWGANEVKIDGIEYLLAKFDDILAIIK